MAKKGNYAGITELNESAFFRPPTQSVQVEDRQNNTIPEPQNDLKKAKIEPKTIIPPPSSQKEREGMEKSDSSHASKQASMIVYNRDMIEAIRKSVKRVGKEVSFVRLTPEEKKQLVDIAYTYKSGGIKTSENEISRIGINFMLEDYQENGQESILAKVLEALND